MSTAKPDRRVRGFQFSAWNLLLLIPLLILVTPLFNSAEPRLFGMPFFYWFQLVFVVAGVLCTGIVYWATRNKPANPTRDERDVDDLDEGNAR
ncbi:uncharacterized protein DUF3311 [Amycolatopsis sulphurea]|uniref:Uncharacterized protein DUF3311 n=1 Tax=Amycolatopsis sulphurea TaxID=76022 RepID=A0A2A9FCX9_9PSEU|nr:DUF3311 domain-containing protein [Amycolatopsis sulphurea]PFG48412.1 uncharacterized protein DUF3311 [Amycolatopsis sulphurea]